MKDYTIGGIAPPQGMPELIGRFNRARALYPNLLPHESHPGRRVQGLDGMRPSPLAEGRAAKRRRMNEYGSFSSDDLRKVIRGSLNQW